MGWGEGGRCHVRRGEVLSRDYLPATPSTLAAAPADSAGLGRLPSRRVRGSPGIAACFSQHRCPLGPAPGCGAPAKRSRRGEGVPNSRPASARPATSRSAAPQSPLPLPGSDPALHPADMRGRVMMNEPLGAGAGTAASLLIYSNCACCETSSVLKCLSPKLSLL